MTSTDAIHNMNYRRTIRQIFDVAVNSVKPDSLIRNSVQYNGKSLFVGDNEYTFKSDQRIFACGSGKASVKMTETLVHLLNNRIAGGVVLCNEPDQVIGPVQILHSSHPLPDQAALNSTQQLIDLISELSENDSLIYVLSGGSSAMVEKPVPPITLDDVISLSGLLLRSGLSISEMNVIRKHLSLVKGGRLGQITRASGTVLVLSDVIGDNLSAIGSGLLYKDDSTFADTAEILNKYNLTASLPDNVKTVLNRGLRGEIPETPKLLNPKIRHHIVGNIDTALYSAQSEAQRLGFHAHILPERLFGEARESGKNLLSLCRSILDKGVPYQPPVCLIAGGETTVTVRGTGKGGRNQELCLSALNEIRDNPHITLLSAGTDGIDGNSDAAGAVIDAETFIRSKELNLDIDDYLSRNDSYRFLEQTGSLIMTGPSGTNVCDIMIVMIHDASNKN